VQNNPIRYNDPTGHVLSEANLDDAIYSDLEEEEPPEPEDETTGWNPFYYPTLTISVHNFSKAILGVEADLNFNFNWDALKRLDFNNVNWSVSISGGGSLGASVQEGIFFSLTGSNTQIGDFSSVSGIWDERSWNASICIPTGECGGIAPTTENSEITSSSFVVGVGEGVDFSVDILSGEAELFAMHPIDGPSTPMIDSFNTWATNTWNDFQEWFNNW
jgi:hypothetical protein